MANITIKKAERFLFSKKDFYVKFLQENNVNPIDKFVWNSTTNQYDRYILVMGNWVFQKLSNPENVSVFAWLKYIFIHNDCIMSFDEMKDYTHYNNK